MNKLRPQHSARRSGLTLVELIVGTGVLVVVLGLALGMAIQSEKASRKITRRNQAILYCQSAIDRAVELIGTAIAPASLSGLQNQTIVNMKCEQGRLECFVYDDSTSAALCRLSLSAGQDEGHGPVQIWGTWDPVAETLGTGAARQVRRNLGGTLPEGFSAQLEFGYAQAPQPGQPVQYAPTWNEERMPDLVRVTVRARLDDLQEQAIELQTAVIPGLIAAAPPAAPVLTETAEPLTTGTLTGPQATSPTLEAAQ